VVTGKGTWRQSVALRKWSTAGTGLITERGEGGVRTNNKKRDNGGAEEKGDRGGGNSGNNLSCKAA